MKGFPVIILFSLLVNGTFAQKAEFNYGDIYVESYEFRLAIASYKKTLLKEKDVQKINYAYQQIGFCYANLFQYDKAEEYYALVNDSIMNGPPEWLINYGHVLKANGKYAEAKKAYEQYRHYTGEPKVNKFIESIEWAIQNEHVVNSTYRIYETNLDVSGQALGYCYYGDGLIYCHGRNKPRYGESRRAVFDIDYANSENNLEFIGRNNFFAQVDFAFNEMSPCLTPDESTLYFAANTTKINNENQSSGNLRFNKEGISNYSLYMATKKDAVFENLRELPFNGTAYSNIHPCISKDGKTLFFASDRPGGKGGFDLYVVSVNDDGLWGEPINMGDSVNTPENELFPWVNGNQLFFASKGFNGFGGYDVYSASLNEQYQPYDLKNMGLPVNSFRDDVAYITKDSGATGYFSSNRHREDGSDRVYFFRSYKPGRLSLQLITGLLDTNLVRVSIPGSLGEVRSVDSRIVEGSQPNQDAQSKQTFQSKTFQPILFLFNDASISPSQTGSADSVIAVLKRHPTWTVSVVAFTDSRGRSEYNQRLSVKRANAVKQYLMKKGIVANRIVTMGKGETELLNGCTDGVECSEEQHAINRRVELYIEEAR